jgi:hypothetical protein
MDMRIAAKGSKRGIQQTSRSGSVNTVPLRPRPAYFWYKAAEAEQKACGQVTNAERRRLLIKAHMWARLAAVAEEMGRPLASP